MADIYEYRIHPALGVARMGNSDTSYFLTAEKPRQPVDPRQKRIPGSSPDQTGADGDFRDSTGKLAKQGARFRVFCYHYIKTAKSKSLMMVWECNKSEYDIEWTVKVANLKSTLQPQFDTRNLSTREKNLPNAVTLKTALAGDANKLKTFTGKPAGRLDLGSCFMDTDGRLVVLGSSGKCKALPGSSVAPRTGNSNLNWQGWEDDAADGPITATVKPKASSSKPDKGEAKRPVDEPAWVTITIPDYGADVRASVSLYNLAMNYAWVHAVERKDTKKVGFPKKADLVTYINQVEPILDAYIANRFTTDKARRHYTAAVYTASFPKYIKKNAYYYGWFRKPYVTKDYKPENVFVPFSGEDPNVTIGAPPRSYYKDTDFGMPKLLYTTPTELQYEALADLAGGTLASGSLDANNSNNSNYLPYQLDRAHMESINGRSLFPGIEVGREANYYRTWSAKKGCCKDHLDVRVKNEISHDSTAANDGKIIGPPSAGYLTRSLACPWHADFLLCSDDYWPHSRPVSVKKSTAGAWYDWMAIAGVSLGAISVDGGNNVNGGLCQDWWKLGFMRHDLASGTILESDFAAGVRP